MKIDGACQCGAIRFEAEADPERVSICHCKDCQALTGTAFRWTISVADEDFTLLAGKPKTYIKTAESGRQREQVFCGDCGSPIYAAAVGDGPKVLGVRVGTLRQRAELPPRRQIWHRSALPWIAELFPDLPTAEKEV